MNIRRVNLAFRYMWVAWINLIRWGSMVTALTFLGIALATDNMEWLLPAGIAGAVFLVTLILFLFESSSVRCLGCGGTLLRAMRCAKHKTAKRFLGSYTLHCTLALASYAKSLHCPYCGMRYRISRTTRADKRREEELAEERERAQVAAKEATERKESEAQNRPYY